MQRQLFGPTKQSLWECLCTEIGGTYTAAGLWHGDKVQSSKNGWTITLDTVAVATGTYSAAYTRLRVPYSNPSAFRFAVSRRGLFDDLLKFLGMQDINVGHPDFDRDFIIKGNDESKLKLLFDDEKLRDLLEAQPKVLFSIKPYEDYDPNHLSGELDELCFILSGIVKDVERLKSLFDLLSETLDQLCRIGAANRAVISGEA